MYIFVLNICANRLNENRLDIERISLALKSHANYDSKHKLLVYFGTVLNALQLGPNNGLSGDQRSRRDRTQRQSTEQLSAKF